MRVYYLINVFALPYHHRPPASTAAVREDDQQAAPAQGGRAAGRERGAGGDIVTNIYSN